MTRIWSEWKKPPRAEPRFVGEPDGIEDERIVFPAADRVPHVRVLGSPPGIVRPAVERDHPELRVPAGTVDPAPVDHRDVVIGVEDSCRRSLPRNAERKAGHDRVVFVRPLIEFDHLVPMLGLVHRLTLIEPRRRHEHPVRALIGPLHAFLRLERSASPEHIAAGPLKTAAGSLPGTCQVRLPVSQSRRRSLAPHSAAVAAELEPGPPN